MSETDNPIGAEQREIERLEEQETQAMRGADVSTLRKLWADDLIVNSTANLIAGKQILLDMVENGLLKLQTYERRPVRIVTLGDMVVTTGNEVSQVVANAAQYKMFVSYMNVWMKRAGNWQLVARHVGMIQRALPEP
jgi:ketosteroid isomerase-like protein